MNAVLNISEFLDLLQRLPVIDVRSPAEFERGHIPGAVNLPLFSNEERSVIGTLYLKKGTSEAMLKGLELVGPKMKEFASQALGMSPGGQALLHCWRGGMRSNSMAWLFNQVGIETGVLEGGYKSFRNNVHLYFTKPFNLIILAGMTGSGKTDVLETLEKKGKQVIHLERLANHKGSVFGGLGMDPQPTTEQFENDLFMALMKLDPGKIVYVEDESLAIGRIFIPRPFHDQMVSARSVNLVVPVQRRIQQLVCAYAGEDRDLLISAVERIRKRIGPEGTSLIIQCIIAGEMDKAVEKMLFYYDKVYHRTMNLNKRAFIQEIRVQDENMDKIADKVIALTEKLPSYGNI